MRKSRFSEPQIIDAIKRIEGGVPVKDVYRELVRLQLILANILR